jgi:hypothetical protein
MGRTACTEPQCLYKGTLYLTVELYLYSPYGRMPPVPILSQLHPVHTPTTHFPKIHSNIILPSTPGSPQWPLSLMFPHQHPVHPSPIRATCPAHSFFLILPPAQYWVRSTDYSAAYYVIFSIPLSPRPF